MKPNKIYYLGQYTNIPQITYESQTYLIPDYLTKLGFSVNVEPKEVDIAKKECILMHIENLKETPILMIDVTESCGFNIPWDIGYLCAIITKKVKNKILVLLKFGAVKNEKSRWRMEHSIQDLRNNLELYEPRNENELKIVIREIRNPASVGILEGVRDLFKEATNINKIIS